MSFSDFTYRKIAHLRRAGLVAQTSSGFGMTGGACPDWLLAEQKARAEKARRDDMRKAVQHFNRQEV